MNLTQMMISTQETVNVIKAAIEQKPPETNLVAFYALQGMATQMVITMHNENTGMFSGYDDMERWLIEQVKIALRECDHADSMRGKRPS